MSWSLPSSSRKYWLLFLVIIIVQLFLVWRVVVGVRTSHLTEIKQNAAKNIIFLTKVINDKLQDHNYVSADYFLQNWGESHSHRVEEIVLTMANGFILSHYQSPARALSCFSLTQDIPYSYRGKAQLKIVISLDSVGICVNNFIINMVLLSLFFYLSLGLVVSLYLRQKKMALDLIASEKRYRAIFDSPNDAIFIHDAENENIVDVNQAMLEMFECDYETALKMSIADLNSGKQEYFLDKVRAKFAAAIQQGPQLFEWQPHKLGGETFWSEVGLKHWEFEGRDYVVAVVRDISERKLFEAKLASEQERLRVTLRSIGDGVLTTDINGCITLINKAAEDMTGWTQDEARGKSLLEVFSIINEKTGICCENPVEKVLALGQIVELANHTVLVARDGTRRSIADSGAPIRDRESRIIGAVLVFRDVTEKNRLEEESMKLRKLESVGVLAGGIAHDFNNILTAILGNISLALTSTDPHDDIYELLTETEKASLRAKKLTQQLLIFAKGGEPVKKIAAIAEVIKDSAGFVLHGSKVRSDFALSEELWTVNIDTGQISQVVQNIIINADQAMPSGGVIAITGSNYRLEPGDLLPISPGNYVQIVIKDQGVGIPAAMLDKIFDPYFTTKQQGSGLGLAITYSIISKHDGYITVDSAIGQGTTFTIYLPASPGDPETVKSQGVVSTLKTAQGRIMIMDDEEMVRSLVTKALSHIGYDVVSAEDGGEALQLYKEARAAGVPIDLIIMDLTIPGGIGGKDAVNDIHKIDPGVKVIVSSGYSNDPVMADFGEYGFCAALVKPFLMRELMGVVTQALSG